MSSCVCEKESDLVEAFRRGVSTIIVDRLPSDIGDATAKAISFCHARPTPSSSSSSSSSSSVGVRAAAVVPRVLRVVGTAVRHDALCAIASEARLGRIAQLEFRGCAFSSKEFEILASVLVGCPNLKLLGLRGNTICGKSSECVAEILHCNYAPKILDIAECEMKNSDFLKIFGEIKGSSLTHLDISSNIVLKETAQVLLETILHSNLIYLTMENCNISSGSVSILCEGFSKLQFLNLSGNVLYQQGAEAIGEALQSECSLQTLLLEGCNIFPSMALTILSGVKNNSSLSALSLRGNPLGNDVAEEIGKMLSSSSVLSFLNVSDCGINERGFSSIIRGTYKNSHLEELIIGGVSAILSEGEQSLEGLILNNSTLQKLTLDGDLLSNSGSRRICEVASKKYRTDLLDFGIVFLVSLFFKTKQNNNL
eukprot:TRINITY_DN1116_c0_g1_i1.p1 TRINITY_DN1116_c0_g1~~TRINITY_DN1116_c0_g1_i1.p1  ORF type:complete len:425 (-),score=88.38 TRINITY_DN1116_c0_g1_i1:152-1426(-)